MKKFLLYGQWVILLLSILSLLLVSSVKHETRLNGYILTGVSRFSGALVFIFFDLFAFVIANLIQTYIAFRGYYQNKKSDEKGWQTWYKLGTNFLKSTVKSMIYKRVIFEWEWISKWFGASNDASKACIISPN